MTSKHLARRHRAEKRFQFYGLATITVVLSLLALLIGSIVWNGVGAFQKTFIQITISSENLNGRDAIYQSLRSQYPQATEKMDRLEVHQLISPSADIAVDQRDKKVSSMWILASDAVDYYLKQPGTTSMRLNADQLNLLKQIQQDKRLKTKFNVSFFTQSASRFPETAGILGALKGSFLTLVVTLLLAFPLGVLAAIYLEEFAPKSRLIHFLEVNIANLASVPSIVFGLLGLAVFINVMHLPRSSPLVAGMTLALMTMPTIVIAARSALQTVPGSIRRAAEALGATSVQTVFHHVLPLALPGILTGTILGAARALGESAALLMIGMVAFIVDAPDTVMDPATVLPVQIFNWARSPEQGFVDHTAAAILVLIALLMVMNWGAIVMRKKYEHRW